ncbi:MAG: hypothetical protein ACUVQH_05015 [Thermogutta sp.]
MPVVKSVRIRKSLVTQHIGPVAVISLLVTAIVGCAKFDLRRNIPWQETSDKPVRSVVAFWTEAVIERTSSPPYRGFGGRLLFYPADMSQPVKVQGTVVVYAFDEDLPPPENLKPVRKYVFTNEQLQDVYSESKLGPSYNLLIPWEEFSPQARRISLIVRYIPDNGPSVVSEQVKVFLPGLDNSMMATSPSRATGQNASLGFQTSQPGLTNLPQNPGVTTTGSPIRPVSYQQETKDAPQSSPATNKPSPAQPSGNPIESKRRMETLTLNISPRLGRSTPPQAPGPSESGEKADGAANRQPPQTPETPWLGSDEASWSAGMRTAPLNSPSYGRPITPPSQMRIPPNPGQLIKDLNQQLPTRFEPYQPLAPEGGVSPIPVEHPQSGPSP